MSDYGKLMSRIWSDKDFVALDARSQQVFMMLLSFPTRSKAGVLPLTLRRWANVTADATVENIKEALRVLEAARFIVVDWDTEEVLIRTFIRNDEIWKQPNAMETALRDCEKVGSETLRRILQDELMRISTLMPTGGARQQEIQLTTVRVAKALVETVVEPMQVPISANPYDPNLPLPNGSGLGSVEVVGSYVSSSPTPSPTTSTTAATGPRRQTMSITELVGNQDTPPEPPPPDRGAVTDVMKLVYRLVPRSHPQAVRTMLGIKASEMYNQGTPESDIEAALRLWLQKPNLGPGALPSLVSEVIRNRDNQPLSAVDQKAKGWLE